MELERTAEQDNLHEALVKAATDYSSVMHVLSQRGGRRNMRTVAAELQAESAELNRILQRLSSSDELIEDEYCAQVTAKLRHATKLATQLIDFSVAPSGR